MTTTKTPPTDFEIVLRPEAGLTVDEQLRALRHILKRLGRSYHLKCLAIRPVAPVSDQ